MVVTRTGKGVDNIDQNLSNSEPNLPSAEPSNNLDESHSQNNNSLLVDNDINQSQDSFEDCEEESVSEFEMADERVLKEHLFEGSHYAEWRYMIDIGLMRLNLHEFVNDFSKLKTYKEASVDDRSTKDEFKNYARFNVQALDFVIKRIGFKTMTKFRGNLYAAELLKKMDSYYKISSDVSQDAIRSRLQMLKFRDGGNMRLFVEKFDRLVTEYREAGGDLSDSEEITMFRVSLPSSMNEVRTWWDLVPQEKKTMENLKARAIEIAEYAHRENRPTENQQRNEEAHAMYSHRGNKGQANFNSFRGRSNGNRSRNNNNNNRSGNNENYNNRNRDSYSNSGNNQGRGRYNGQEDRRQNSYENRSYSAQQDRDYNSQNKSNRRNESRNDDRYRNYNESDRNSYYNSNQYNQRSSENRSKNQYNDRDSNNQTNWRSRPNAKNVNCEERVDDQAEDKSDDVYRNFAYLANTEGVEESKIFLGNMEVVRRIEDEEVSSFKYDINDNTEADISDSKELEEIPEPSNEDNEASTYTSYIAALHTGSKPADNRFLLDSGADNHLVNDGSFLTETIPIENIKIQCAHEKQSMKAVVRGTMNIAVVNRFDVVSEIRLKNVLHVPGLHENLMSEDRITEQGFNILFTHNYADIIEPETGVVLFSGKRFGRAKFVKFRIIMPSRPMIAFNIETPEAIEAENENDNPIDRNDNPVPVNNEKNKKELILWHRRMGHPSGKYLEMLSDRSVGVPKLVVRDNEELKKCEVCLQSKAMKKSHKKKRQVAKSPLDRVCVDILEIPTESDDGQKYLLVMIDDFSNFITCFPMRRKSETKDCFRTFQVAMSVAVPGKAIAEIRCDGGRELVCGEVRRIADAEGINIDMSPPYSQELNGKAERANRTLMSRMRCLLIESGFPIKKWPLVAKTAAFLMNRLPTKANEDFNTPYQLLYGEKADLQYQRVFGCIAWMYVPEEIRSKRLIGRVEDVTEDQGEQLRRKPDRKLDQRAIAQILCGFATNSYLLMDPITKKIGKSCDVKCIEDKFYCDLEKERVEVEQPENEAPTFEIEPDEPVMTESNGGNDRYEGMPIWDHDYARAVMSHACSSRCSGDQLSDQIPTNFAEAVRSDYRKKWIEAMNEEFDSHRFNGTWSVVDRAVGMNIIKTRWVYSIKYDENDMELAKARLVARGDKDRNEYGIEQTYSPVVAPVTIKWTLSIIHSKGLVCRQLDIKTAFLYGDVKEDIYLEFPDGLKCDNSAKVLKLNKALYGLKTASKSWNCRLTAELKSIHFTQSVTDSCLFFMNKGSDFALLMVYVDDMVLAANSNKVLEETINFLKTKFRVKIGKLNNFLGMEIEIDGDIMKISQKRYIDRVLKTYGYQDAKPTKSPMETNLRIFKDPEGVDNTVFRQKIGTLLFPARLSRPDIMFAVGYLGRFQTNYTPELDKYVNRIFRYLKGSRDLTLNYRRNGKDILEVFVDAALGNDINDKKSTTGFIIKLNDNTIHWGSRKQKCVCTSSTSAEFYALNSIICEIRFIQRLNLEILKRKFEVIVYEDNESAIRIAKGVDTKKFRVVLGFEDGENHFDSLRRAAVCESIEQGEMRIEKVRGERQIADILTKAVDQRTLERNVETIFNI